MKELLLKPINENVSIKTQARVLDGLLAKQCPVMMACGGNGICATCHVHVIKGHDALTPPTEREKKTLALLSGAGEKSRLSCQCRVIGDGVEVLLPEGMYVQSFNELESLIGQRTKVPILHPRDGRVLVDANKIISRSKIMQLEGEDFDVTHVETAANK